MTDTEQKKDDSWRAGWDRHIKPKEFFLLMAGLIAFGLVIRVSGFQYIPTQLIMVLPIVGVLMGGRMLYQNRKHEAFQTLAIATGVTALVGIVLAISLGLSIGDPVVDPGEVSDSGEVSDPIEASDLYNECAEDGGYACDRLFMESTPGSNEQAFGANCGDRGYTDENGIWCSPEGLKEFGGAQDWS